jgi:hypothetical protein
MRPDLFRKTQTHIFCLFLLLLPLAKNVWGNTLSLEEYRSRIKDTENLLQSREGKLQSEEIAALQERFPPEFQVTNQGGVVIRVEGDTLRHWINEARNSPEGRKQLLEHLRALSEQLAWGTAELQLTTSEWRETRARLDDVYRAEEFQHLQEPKPPGWWTYLEGLLKRLMKWLREHMGSLEGVPLQWISYAVFGVLMLAGIIVMVWILRSSGSLGWRRRQRALEHASVSVRTPEKDWQTLRAEAENKAQEGAFREAIRAFFVSVLMEGQVRGWWVYQKEATNREHFARVGGPEERRNALRQMIDLYEEAWYGLREPKEDAFRDCKNWLRRMEAGA